MLKEQIKRAFWVQRVTEMQQKTAPKAGKEEKGVHKVAAASKPSGIKTRPQAGKAQRETSTASSAVTGLTTRGLEVGSTFMLNGGHQARQMENSAAVEFMNQTGPTNREKRARAFKQSQVTKMEEQAAAKGLMKAQEERRLAAKAAAPVLSAAAKRRSRAKRNAGSQSRADVAKA